jgi:hypothetical protein
MLPINASLLYVSTSIRTFLVDQKSVHRMATFQFFTRMARNTLPRRGLVKQYGFSRYRPIGFVTTFATHVAMCSLQCKRRLLVMVEHRRFPSRAVMTICALRDAHPRKLRRMRICVASLASWRPCFEIRDAEARSWVYRFVAPGARRFVGAEQRECSLRMVKA